MARSRSLLEPGSARTLATDEYQTMKKVIEYEVSDEKQTTEEHTLTPRTILGNAGFDPETHYLMAMRGHEKESFKDHPGDPIHVHPHMKFLAISCAPTPVS